VKIEQKVALLSQTALFEHVDPTLLVQIANRAMLRTYRRGQFIFNQGDDGGSLVVVASGLVQLVKNSEQGGQLVIGTVHPRGFMGEVTLIDQGQRTASAEVLAQTTVLVLPQNELFAVLRSEPALAEALLVWFARALRRSGDIIEDLAFRDLPGRLARLLIGTTGAQAAPGAVFSLTRPRRTQKDLAEVVGGSRQSVNQILRSFQDRGWIRMDRQGIVLLRPDLLSERAGGVHHSGIAR
jgi:CRP-like cAMP-binding protein